MSYTILSAQYSNAFNTAAILRTIEAGDVAASESDTPELWARLMAWGVPTAYAPPAEPFPVTVTAAQAKIALYNAGLLDQVRAAVQAHPYELVRLWYENAGVWERGNPYVQALGVEIGLTDEQIDELFIAASRI